MKPGRARQERLAAQREFMETLREGKTDAVQYAGGARGLKAYRANAQVLAEQVLGQAFPRLRAGFGDASFSAMAWACWRQYPPALGDMGEWGAALPRFLLDHGVEPWWVDLARLEWAAHQAERARDDVFDAESLALMTQEDPKDITLLLRSGSTALSVHRCAWTCWQDPLQAHAACENENRNSQQPALHLWVWRAPWQAQVQPIGSAEAAFMAALMQGVSLARALAATHRPIDGSPSRSVKHEDQFDFDTWLRRALAGGWLVGAAAIRDEQG